MHTQGKEQIHKPFFTSMTDNFLVYILVYTIGNFWKLDEDLL